MICPCALALVHRLYLPHREQCGRCKQAMDRASARQPRIQTISIRDFWRFSSQLIEGQQSLQWLKRTQPCCLLMFFSFARSCSPFMLSASDPVRVLLASVPSVLRYQRYFGTTVLVEKSVPYRSVAFGIEKVPKYRFW